ncbi:MAG TPA: hypothetical protein VET51_12675 [Burkholderiales bacterium]|nr:hypothetical protein [Burkholderiales bacterium]
MTSGFVHRARAFHLFGTALAFAGFLPVLLFIGHSFLPAAEEFPWAWLMNAELNAELWLPVERMRILNGLDIGLVLAVLGVVAMALGATIARLQMAALDAGKERRADRLRRVQQYRNDSQLEPFIGSGFGTGKDAEWISPAQDRAMDAPRRRIA